MSSPADWFNSLPPITKAWGTCCFATTCLVQLHLLDPRLLDLSFSLVFGRFHVWRLLTNFLFLGNFGMRFVMNLIVLARQGVQLESSTYAGRTSDFLFMVLFSALSMLVASLCIPFIKLPFLSAALVFVIIYVWSREFPNASVNIFGLISVAGFYLPWLYVLLDLMLGGDVIEDLLGIAVGHLYYFLTVIYPATSGRVLLQTPFWLHNFVLRQRIGQPPVANPPQPIYPQQPQAAAGRGGGRAAPAASPSPYLYRPGGGGGSSGSAFTGQGHRLGS
eukprot:TRINITY_DN905_c0_g1_i1.p1 TRINITY_DN905_c0_g1~~TRINITY_DN905_c0_g1_i1.p1  ORF type:complete len:276 (-),score=71.06 TRINITY_DN905_c0_g1_i1:19-846(-)